jgi:hypothetical protein
MNDPAAAETSPSATVVAVAAPAANNKTTAAGRKVSPASVAAAAPMNVTDAVTVASVTQAAQLCAHHHLPGLAHVLSQRIKMRDGASVVVLLLESSSPASSSTTAESSTNVLIPPSDVIEVAAKRALGSFADNTDDAKLSEASLLASPLTVHWSKQDLAAGTLKIVDGDKKCLATCALRGYRSARANVGYSGVLTNATTSSEDAATTAPLLYYEVLLHEGPTAHEMLQQLPTHCRLGAGLQRKLNRAYRLEEERAQKSREAPPPPPAPKRARTDNDEESSSASSDPPPPVPSVGGHVRVGFAMRTADLFAPVGYDRWSFAIRSLSGSIIHQSLRQDDWMDSERTTIQSDQSVEDDKEEKANRSDDDDDDATPFAGPGDVIGCGIQLSPPAMGGTSTSSGPLSGSSHGTSVVPPPSVPHASAASGSTIVDDPQNPSHIRFFLNGTGLGQFVMAKGKREGGEAFSSIAPGTYYPAVSLYMGGQVTANFGPYFVCTPKKLPTRWKGNVQPASALVAPPKSPEATVHALQHDPVFKQLFKGMNLGGGHNSISAADWQKALCRAAECEARVRCQAYQDALQRHIAWVRQERLARGLSVNDLPPIEKE